MLGLPEPRGSAKQVILPFTLALDGSSTGGIGITTRSVYQLVGILAAAIEVPEADRQNGVANSYPPPGLAGKDLRVRYSASRPAHASVAENYRDGWFYIDETDQATKRFFRLLGSLWSITIAESAAGASNAPVLTVPVSR